MSHILLKTIISPPVPMKFTVMMIFFTQVYQKVFTNAFKDRGALIHCLFVHYGFLSDFKLSFPLNLTAWSLLQLPQIWEDIYFSLFFVSYLLSPEETEEIYC